MTQTTLPVKISEPVSDQRKKLFRQVGFLLVLLGLSAILSQQVEAQRTQSLFGDVKINEEGWEGPPAKVMIILNKDVGGEVARQAITNGSQYRFSNLQGGDYQLIIEVNNQEVGTIRVSVQGLSNDPHGFRQDLEFALKPKGAGPRPGVVSADAYTRSGPNKSLFQKAQEAADKKKYDQAISFLKEIVENDKLDYQAWTLLGTVFVVQQKSEEAETAYLSAIEAKPTFALALLDLGKLRSSAKKFDQAIDPLTRAVESQPTSGDANYLLGEAYIQLKKGSKAIPYLNEAAKLGQPDAHLRLGWLYNAAGMKDKAATEYEEFLKKKPDYPDRKKLEDYIAANKKN